MTELTILMPCLNEAETIEVCVRKAMRYLDESGIDGEVVIADNGSTDGSQAMAEALGARVVHVPMRGYGAALIAGIDAARGTYVIMGDSDDSYDFSRLDAFVDELRNGADLVMGNRFRGGIARGAMPPLHRYLGNPVLSTLGRIFFRAPVGDFHCGLRGFSRQAILDLNLTTPGMEFASEMVIRASVTGLKMTEVPTTLSPDGRSRPPHLRSWRDGWRHLKLLLTYAPHWLFLYPGLALAAFGSVIYAGLLSGPISMAGVTFDTATLILASALILIGVQLVSFYGLARLHSVNEGLLPRTSRFERMSQSITVDRCCQVGGLLLLAGAVSAALAVVVWAQAGWGDLSASWIARPSSFSVICLALGVQSIMGGFLWGFLSQKAEAKTAETAPVQGAAGVAAARA
ncbi:glycosyltransferase family 2 protein [Gymnodinialimonas sp. 2305UL16-5]|uniref:glycosyltransferase family 2 protein n=1 Tax=Gymnodinialimonas mytili TaxID=3126503 RepID=UPI00309F8433